MPIFVPGPIVLPPILYTVKLLAVIGYYATFSNLFQAELEEIYVKNDGYNTYYDSVYQYELELLKDPANIPVEDVAKDVLQQVTLPSGTIVNGKEYSKTRTFHNIPFAEPPVGELRFEDPVPYKQPAVIDATNNVKILCPQSYTADVTEDCLYLSVHVPAGYQRDPDNLLPVLLWIHGGSFAYGYHYYKLEHLSNSTETIIVSTNYRLGYLGFLTYDAAGISGNQGIKDQRMALKWVHDNIEAFGGNKDEVTLFGESSGGKSVEFHLVSEQSKPYFKRAIIQSTYTDPHANRQDSNTITDLLIAQFQLRFKCGLFQSGIECLKTIPFEDLLEVNDYYTNATLSFAGARSCMAPETDINGNLLGIDLSILLEGARPYIDGDDIKDKPSKMFHSGQWSVDKDVIVGHTNGEGNVLALLPYNITKSQATEWAITTFGAPKGSIVMDAYEEMYPDLRVAQWLDDANTDYWMACYARAIARDMSDTGSGSVHFYEFSQPSSATNVLTGEPINDRGKAIH